MAPDKKVQKRKAPAASADSPAKKTKQVAKPAEEPKSILKKGKANGAKEEKVKPKEKSNGDAARPVKPRKRAADYMSDEDSDAEVPAKKAEDTKKKPSAKKTKQEDGTAAPVKEKAPKAKDSKKAKKVEIAPSDSESEAEGQGVKLNAEDGEDDQTTALIRGFESSGDEDESGDEGLDPDAPVPKIPDSKKAKRKILKAQKAKSENSEQPGAVYVGRIPHGFYEHQMRSYFSQFGDITRLRLSRNRTTGASKHYAFIEFASDSVARIVAATMDNYLMFGHILKCKYIPTEQLHPELWKGANRRFKATPWNRIEQKRLEKGRSREGWSRNIEAEQKRRAAKARKMVELGYEFEMPDLKSVDDVPVQVPEVKAVEGEEQAKAIEADPEAEKVDKEDTPKKAKKEKKSKKVEAPTPVPVPTESPKAKTKEAAEPVKAKKKSKAKAKA